MRGGGLLTIKKGLTVGKMKDMSVLPSRSTQEDKAVDTRPFCRHSPILQSKEEMAAGVGRGGGSQ